MWVIIPVKRLDSSKLRLAPVLTPAQRRQLSLCMLEDILDTLAGSAAVGGVTVVSCDTNVMKSARAKAVDVLDTKTDGGYAVDVLKGIEHITGKSVRKTLIIPADVPELEERDLAHLDRVHREGVTLCPAANDGGTNGLVFTQPLPIDLKYGENSFDEFRREAEQRRIPLNIAKPAGLGRDIDRPEDLLALRSQSSGNRTWRHLKSIQFSVIPGVASRACPGMELSREKDAMSDK